jgi:hypothetical protein
VTPHIGRPSLRTTLRHTTETPGRHDARPAKAAQDQKSSVALFAGCAVGVVKVDSFRRMQTIELQISTRI